MWRLVVCSGVVLLACNGSSKRDDEKSAPTVAPVQQAIAVDAMVAGDSGGTAAKPVVEGIYATRVERYLAVYLDLLWVDLALSEMLVGYPGAPAKNRYTSYTFDWKLPELDAIEKVLTLAKVTAERAGAENGATEHDVLAYTTRALLVWPPLRALADYYKQQRYVDDEFAQGRRDAPLVAEAIAKLAPLRTRMRESVFAGWRDAAGDKPESPRAIIGASFEACLRVANLIFARPKNGKLDERGEEVIEEAIGACRRGVGAVSALPEVYRSFDAPLRSAAIAFGNAVDSDFTRQYAIGDVERLVKAYIERWPKLPSEPAERPEKK